MTPTPADEMDFGRRFTELTGLNVTNIIHSVVEAVADRSSYTLEERRHAPRKQSAHPPPAGQIQVSLLFCFRSLIACCSLSLKRAIQKSED
jgi:hypothetical protein